MKPDSTLLLTRSEVAELLTIEECIKAVESVFRLSGEGKTQTPGILGVHARNGGFHIKAGLLNLNQPYFAAKLNANFPENAKRFGLPLVQGVVVLCDAESGYPLALMDSIEITILRTGAATAVAAKYLARSDSKTILICGCGNQGAISLRAISQLFKLERAFAYDLDPAKAEDFTTRLAKELEIEICAVQSIGDALSQSDICVTCTPAKEFFVKREMVPPGTFIAAVGADNEEKQEIDPLLLKENKIVVDVRAQCAAIGELHHAIAGNLVTENDVYAELGEVVAGKPGRTLAAEIIIFDSTGMALQDVVSAAAVYESAIELRRGTSVNLAR